MKATNLLTGLFMSFAAVSAATGSLRGLGSAKCTSPYPYALPGCRTVMNGTMTAVDELESLAGFSGGWLDEVIRPLLMIIKTQVAAQGPNYQVVNSKVCFGKYQGSSIPILSKCRMIPVDPDSDYTMLEVSLPASFMSPVCQLNTAEVSMVSVCMLLSLCSDIPTVGFTVDKGAAACLAGMPDIEAATVGVSALVKEGLELGFSAYSAALSPTSDLQKALTVYDGDNEISINATANLAESLSLGLSSESMSLPDYLSLSLKGTRLINLVNSDRIAEVANSNSNIKDVLSAVTDGFSAGLTGSIRATFKLGSLTKNAFPDLLVPLAEATGFISAASEEITGVQRGLYVFADAKDVIGEAVKSVLKKIIPLISEIIDSMFGDGAANALVDNLTPDDDGEMKLGMATNQQLTGLYLASPVSKAVSTMPPFNVISGISPGWLGDLKIECKFEYAGAKFSCKVDYKVPKFFTMVYEAGKWIVRHAIEFFDETGKIAVVVSEALVDGVEKVFSKKNIQATAKALEGAADTVGDELASWGKGAVSWCGTTTVTNAAECGVDTVTDAAICGTKIVSDGAKCGWDIVTSCLWKPW
eukprot:CAMPEP_0203751648 /NCGR_PEP_ID=MMETSP0098-20131031/5687_1 /ASSEMBLY_ACC=CAM_ASM_000208 /TAXON_ID=96639 /ORGANISM=" , Strain NY0313808BC1" /LENGTH=585 /DNA_ID=CAMNT_0050641467 /DNA_START=57 /DNA_END=1811 /DNA_ORIENTATION=-